MSPVCARQTFLRLDTLIRRNGVSGDSALLRVSTLLRRLRVTAPEARGDNPSGAVIGPRHP